MMSKDLLEQLKIVKLPDYNREMIEMMAQGEQRMGEDHTVPGEKWKFDKDVTDVFDNMLERSIPQYDVMRNSCYDLAVKFAQRDTNIVDLGCSRGEAMKRLIDHFGINNRFVGVEVSQPMLEAVRQRFDGLIRAGVVEILDMDLRTHYPPVLASVTLCVLTLQFTPIEYRLQILDNIYKHTASGGALILVEKVLGGTSSINDAMVENYWRMKMQNGYTADEVERKRLSLEGVLVPLTARMNEEQLHIAGFREVDTFWRWMNFAAWIAVKS